MNVKRVFSLESLLCTIKKMKEYSNNPSTNILGSGISKSDVDHAINKSGYPLQTIVANLLRKEFQIEEEWSFIDSKTKEIRAIDIMAEKPLYDYMVEHPTVRPTLNLIIECKQSELPYVFFFSAENRHTNYYPVISGLFKKDITLSTNDDNSTWSFSLRSAFGLDDHQFLHQVPSSMTFSKCVRKGKDIVLSGADGYHNLVLPIITSMHHFDDAVKPPKTALYFDAHLTFGIGVVDSPMIGVTVKDSGHEQEMIPWVRVFRHESYEHENWWERKKLFAIDIVHKDFVNEFVSKNLLPFAREFAQKILKHQEIVVSGKGFAKGLGQNSQEKIEERLEKRKFGKSKILPNIFSRKDENE